MTEMTKTLSLLAVAVVALLVAFLDLSTGTNSAVQERVGTLLNQFEDTPPKRMVIIKFDQENLAKREFEVAEDEGLWSIPSKEGYPADATERMAEAATCMMNLEILRVAAQNASEHAAMGVVDPSSTGLSSKSKGIGTRVIMSDETDETLTDMIIGKQVKDANSQFYLRNTNQDAVFVVELSPDKLSTRFEDWIESDLLQINPMDIRRVLIKDYTAEMRPVLSPNGMVQFQVGWDRRGEMTLVFDSEESKWSAELLQELDREKGEQGELVSYTLAEDEQLNDDALSALRTALDELLIVDVERKPEGLSADLKAGGDFLQNNETATALAMKGFAPVGIGPDSTVDILSSEGEIVCTMNDGVEYVLRFGNLQLGSESAAEARETEDAESQDGINRYLFVMARFNASMIEQPELAELPELPESGEDASEEGDESTESEPGEPASPDGEADETTEDENKKKDEEETLIAEREAIEKQNQRLQDEYEKNIAASEQRVKYLNERFGDWYYVIDNQVYNQIHLGRDKVIVKKEQPAEGEEGASADSPASSGIPGLPNLPIGK